MTMHTVHVRPCYICSEVEAGRGVWVQMTDQRCLGCQMITCESHRAVIWVQGEKTPEKSHAVCAATCIYCGLQDPL